jgi:hypothetical protein
MSKLRGYSGVVLQQLDLNNIEANSITATNGNFTNLTLSTYTIGTLNVGNLVASGQVVKLTGIPNNTTTEDLQILVRSSIDNNVYRVLDVSINPNTGLIKAGELQLTAVPNIPSGGSSAFYKMLFLHSTGNIYKSVNLEYNEVDEILKTPKLQISSIATPTASTNYPLLIIDNDEIKKAPVADIFYNKSNQSLTAYDIVSSNEIYYKNQTLDQRFEPLGGGGGGGSFVTTDTTQTITGTKSFTATTTTFNKIDTSSDVTIGGDMEVYTAITLRDTANNAKTFKLSTAGSTTAPFIRMKNFLHTGNYQIGLLTDETRLYGETCIDFEVDDANGSKTSYLKVENSNVTCNTNLSVTGNITKSGDAIKTQVENDLLYCKLQGTQTIAGIKTFSDSAVFSTNVNIGGSLTKSGDAIKTQVENDLLYCKLTGSQTISGDKTFSGLINASQIQIASINESSISNDQPILFLDSNSKIRTNTGLTIKPSTSQLKASSLLCSSNITGANVTLSNLISPSSASNVDYPILFRGVSNVIMKGAIEYNHHTETLKVPKIESDLSTTNIRTLSNGKIEFDSGSIEDHQTDAYLSLKSSGNTQTGYSIGLWGDGHIRLNALGSGYRFYMVGTQQGATVVSEVFRVNNSDILCKRPLLLDSTSLTEANTTTNVEYKILFSGNNGYIQKSSNALTYNNSTNKMTLSNISCLNNIEMPQTVNFSSSLTSGGGNRNMRIPFIDVANTDTTNRLMRIEGTFTYNPSSDSLSVGNIILTDDLKAPLSTVASSTNTDMPLLFHNETSLSIKKVDLSTSNGSYNASQDKFKMTNLEIINTLDFNNSVNASINFTSTLPTPGPGETNAHTVPFIDSYNSTTTQRKMKHTVGFSYTPSEQQLKCPKLLVTDKITVDDSLHYGTGATTQPLNYTFRIGHTDDINTVNIAGGTNHGSWGGGNVLSILKSGCKATSYGQNSKLWTFNAYNISSSTPTSFTMAGLPGLWHIIVTVDYMTSASSSSNRVNPILNALLNGSTTITEGAQSSYIRHQLGRVGTVKWENKLYFNTNDTIAFRTYANYSSLTGFSYILSSSNYTATKFMFMASYLGPLDEHDQSEP